MTNALALQIVCPHAELRGALADFFQEIERSGDAAFFHPHPFTDADAERICAYTGSDQYYVLLWNGRILGYGMLRGWDAGYATPSLGIIVREEARGSGLGKLLMQHLHAAARLRAAPKIRLKVYLHNTVARHMYEQLGYTFENQEGDQAVGYCSLA